MRAERRARGPRRKAQPKARPSRKSQQGASEITQSRVALTPLYGPIVPITRSTAYLWTYDATATDRNFSVDWSLSDVPNSTEFTSLFSQWRLTGGTITLTWLPKDANALTAPRIYFGMDPFITGNQTFTSVQERPHRTWSPTPTRNVLQLALKPRVVQLVATGPQSSATVANAVAPPGLWYDCTMPAIAYGKLWIFMTGFGEIGSFSVKQDYMFQFRGTR